MCETDEAMKNLYAVAGSLITILILAAFNPDAVLDAYDIAKIRLVEMPRAVERLEERDRGADRGNMVDVYHIAMYHVSSSDYHWPAYYGEVLGEKHRVRGMNMMHRAADAGHPEALFMISQFEAAGDEYLLEAIEKGSNQAIGQLYLHLLEDPCDESARAYLDIVNRRLADADYPWLHPDATESQKEMREYGKEQLRKDLEAIDAVSAETCATV